MSLQYEVRNAFSSAHGTFSVGTRIPAEEVAEWDKETLGNRVLNGDIVPVKAEAVESEPVTEKPEENTEKPETGKETTRKGK